MKKPLTLSIGIAALNEEQKIGGVLANILAQNEEDWTLKEILVYSDGSTDRTNEIVQSIKDKRVKLIADTVRRGKTFRLKQMFAEFSGEILVMFDADITLKDNDVVSKLIAPFSDPNVMLVGGNSRPFPPKTFVEKAVYTTFEVFDDSRNALRGGHNVFGCTGSILAIRNSYAKKLTLPSLINEDAFLYLSVIKDSFLFKYAKDAVIYYKLPNNFGDYIRQSFRSDPQAVTTELDQYFGKLADDEFARPMSFYVSSALQSFVRNPLGVLIIAFSKCLFIPFYSIVSKNYKLDWFTARSTK